MSTFLVTGPTGNVGRHVGSALSAAGHEARALPRGPASAVLPHGVTAVRGDLSSPGTPAPALRDVDSWTRPSG
ncbi:NAD(P)H-binding protein [Nonomuraea sp. bgisy101]|uniref:NmrA family NAD(P)-binding protein n=1 Tax=Nonomuraea sp. bgisy101 TaxID=3413784 RepID=UPI003D749926